MLKYEKLFTTVCPLEHDSVTIFVECIEGGGYQVVSIRSLKGEYESTEEYMDANNRKWRSGKFWSLLPLTLSGAQQLANALIEALKAAQEP